MRSKVIAERNRLEDVESPAETNARLRRQNQRLIGEIKALQSQVADLRENLTNCHDQISTLQGLLRSAEEFS